MDRESQGYLSELSQDYRRAGAGTDGKWGAHMAHGYPELGRVGL